MISADSYREGKEIDLDGFGLRPDSLSFMLPRLESRGNSAVVIEPKYFFGLPPDLSGGRLESRGNSAVVIEPKYFFGLPPDLSGGRLESRGNSAVVIEPKYFFGLPADLSGGQEWTPRKGL